MNKGVKFSRLWIYRKQESDRPAELTRSGEADHLYHHWTRCWDSGCHSRPPESETCLVFVALGSGLVIFSTHITLLTCSCTGRIHGFLVFIVISDTWYHVSMVYLIKTESQFKCSHSIANYPTLENMCSHKIVHAVCCPSWTIRRMHVCPWIRTGTGQRN